MTKIMPQQNNSQTAIGRRLCGAVAAASPGAACVIAVGRDTPVLCIGQKRHSLYGKVYGKVCWRITHGKIKIGRCTNQRNSAMRML